MLRFLTGVLFLLFFCILSLFCRVSRVRRVPDPGRR